MTGSATKKLVVALLSYAVGAAFCIIPIILVLNIHFQYVHLAQCQVGVSVDT